MFKLFIKRYFYYISIIALFFTLTSLKSFALCEDPCPTDIPPLDVPWNSMQSVVVNVTFPDGTICAYNVCYCWRGLTASLPEIEVYIKTCSPVDPGCPPTVTPGLLRKLVAEAVLKQNPHELSWPCPPCPDYFMEYRAYYDRCWNNNLPCIGGNSYCQGIYHICCTAGVRTLSWISNNMLGNNCVSPCTGGCP